MARRIGMHAAVFARRVLCRRVKVVLGGRSIAVFLEPMDEALFGRPVDGLVVEGVGEIDNFCSVDFHRTIRFGAARLRMPAVKSKCFAPRKNRVSSPSAALRASAGGSGVIQKGSAWTKNVPR